MANSFAIIIDIVVKACSTIGKQSIVYNQRTLDAKTFAPDVQLERGDSKCKYELNDGGKLIKIIKKNGDIHYILRCVDGRQVFIEKSNAGCSLVMVNKKGAVTKSLAAQY
ncbi:unnamed protein product [Caenorhabditis bovis]|uniref:Uncharacterized protein n=1 Tax=Caenorhabditis bovis TaxID=2654633 RepID=A0A8S1F501_9PELO|nr:unnamed protein product [Caenorhabditis bovis]